MELDTRMDDTALNTIQLHCAYHLEGVPDDLDAGWDSSYAIFTNSATLGRVGL